MNTKSAAGMIVLAALFLAQLTFAQEKTSGVFYRDCAPNDALLTKIDLDTHLRVTVFGAAIKPDDAYRTKEQAFEGEKPTMRVELCDEGMKNCKQVEAVMTTYKSDGELAEGAIEYFDGTETQGDAESIQGHTVYFEVKKKKPDTNTFCG